VQSVNGVGLVGLATNLGAYYVPGPDTVQPTAPKQATTLQLINPPTSAPYRDQVTLNANLSSNGIPLAGRNVVFGVGAQRRFAVTDAGGNASATMALLLTPGTYQASVSFQETLDLLGSSATSPLAITQRGTSLALTPGCGPVQATLTDTSTARRTLRDRTVMFVVTGGSAPFATAAITDFLGRAPLNGISLPNGTYTVLASFGQVVNVGSQTLTLLDERYSGSSASAPLILGAADTTLTFTGHAVIPVGSSLLISTTVSSPRDLTGALVCNTVRDDSNAVVAFRSAPVVNNASSVTVAGLGTGVYTVESVLTGGTTGAGFFTSSLTTPVAVFDPHGGSVTGAGSTPSPAGHFAANPALAGQAAFGFVARSGATIPTGQTVFQFKPANLRFKSRAYDWLVVAGARAQFKGSGTINGSGNFGFMVTVIDGQISGAGVDRFRMKIWDEATGNVVYDTQPGDSDTADPTTPISGGSIVISQ
jgi:hypothetical protein